jgi:cation diffusion facilitator CzcD-associated flavoprotein CzcO
MHALKKAVIMPVNRNSVVIVGAGFAGICMGVSLKKAGIHDFVIIEGEDGPGGTWRVNTYPGAACDVQSHLYSFSFEPNPNWSRMFSPQEEILKYQEHCCEKYGLNPHCEFNTYVQSATLDEHEGKWRVEASNGVTYIADFVVSGSGGLSKPAYPDIQGKESFKGPAFHSAQWDHTVSLKGKRVAVIGSGASAIQLVPAIVDEVTHIDYYQRTPSWVLPKPDREVTSVEKSLFKAIPALQNLYRGAIYAAMEARAVGFVVDPRIMSLAQKFAEGFIKKEIKDPELRKKVTPTYTMGCKRILMANDYYPALAKEHVEVITDSISSIDQQGITTSDGKHRPVDVIIYCTGFYAAENVLQFDIIGKEGRNLDQEWQDGAEAYLGTAVSGYPNMFIIVGPNTGLGHNSMIYMIESQVHYIMEALKYARKNDVQLLDVKPEVQKQYNEKIHARLDKSVWNAGCTSWYRTKSGKNTTLWPGFTFEFRARTYFFKPGDFVLTKRSELKNEWQRKEATVA